MNPLKAVCILHRHWVDSVIGFQSLAHAQEAWFCKQCSLRQWWRGGNPLRLQDDDCRQDRASIFIFESSIHDEQRLIQENQLAVHCQMPLSFTVTRGGIHVFRC